MDLSCIILSGDLELYVLGMLPEDEAVKISQLARIFPEVQQEIDRIETDLLATAGVGTAQPSARLKDKLLEAARNQPAAEMPASSDSKAPIAQAKVISMRKAMQPMMVAAVLFLILSLAAVVILFASNAGQKKEIAALEKRVQETNNNLTAMQRQASRNQELLLLLQNNNVAQLKLEPLPGKPAASVQLLWNKETSEVFVYNSQLPSPPAGKQYQLWAIVDGQPVSAGVLSDNTTTLEKMQSFSRADAFAITLEKAGGSDVPTLSEMYVMGKVS